MKLSLRSTTGAKIVVVFFAVFAICCASVPVIALGTTGGRSGNLNPVGTVAAVVVFALLLAGLIWMTVSILRSHVRLDGSVVTFQKAFTSKNVDLATATALWFDERPLRRDNRASVTVPVLCARRSDGTIARIPLSNLSSRLPPDELNALATAIESGVREGEQAREAAAVAHQLRTWSYRLPR
ncbi:hypothetical protein AB0I28_03065 [Phytomonospora sp. NPDC050363]|uniref:hypothetical protein n=1 Tax=Phytomonospora sp. NPDC050363 TaxID=3155642 RepID=UPI0033DC827F